MLNVAGESMGILANDDARDLKAVDSTLIVGSELKAMLCVVEGVW